ncbi:MAG: universal stress protein [Xanthomonadales bacterium]|nr:universal stress protein [Xanthomonadales bacterium]
MNESRCLVVGTDGSEPAGRAVDFAIEQAVERNLKLILATIVDWPSGMLFPEAAPVAPALDAEWFERAENEMMASARAKILDREAEKVEKAGVAVEAVVTFGSPSRELRELAETRNAEGIVVGRHGQGVLHLPIFGGVASSLVQGATCPIYVVP